jgi:hypothetical protein
MNRFPFIGPDHPFHTHIERLTTEVRRPSLGEETLRRNSTTAVHTLMQDPLRFDGRYCLGRTIARDLSNPISLDRAVRLP